MASQQALVPLFCLSVISIGFFAVCLLIIINGRENTKKLAEAEKRKKNRTSQLEYILQSGTTEEKTNALLELQNMKLDELNNKANAAATLWFLGGPPH